jgi:hypothetical protein
MNKYPDHSKWRESRACTRKVKCATRAAAEERARSGGPIVRSVYKCPFCKAWHVTSLPAKEKA